MTEKIPCRCYPDNLPKFLSDVVTAEQHILRFILVNLFYDYLVIFIYNLCYLCQKQPVVQFLTQLVILDSVSTGSQQTGFLNALKDSPARYPFSGTNFRSYCKITPEMCFCLFSCFVGYGHLGLLSVSDFITSCKARFLATCWR